MVTSTKYHLSTEAVDAVQYATGDTGTSLTAIKVLDPLAEVKTMSKEAGAQLIVQTMNGSLDVRVGDYVLKSETGAITVVDQSTFESLYTAGVGDAADIAQIPLLIAQATAAFPIVWNPTAPAEPISGTIWVKSDGSSMSICTESFIAADAEATPPVVEHPAVWAEFSLDGHVHD